MNPIQFVIVGIPQPKGSARAFPLFFKNPPGHPLGAWELDARTGKPRCRVVITSDNPNVKAWQETIAAAAQRALGGVQLEITGAFEIEGRFFFCRPKSHKKSDQSPHIVRPDGDKLLRAACDALKGIVYKDDSQITDHIARKRYAAPGTPARAEITIHPIAADLPLFDERTVPDATFTRIVTGVRDLPRVAARPGDVVPW